MLSNTYIMHVPFGYRGAPNSRKVIRVTPALRELASELRTDIVSGKATPALSAGVTSGLGLLAAQVAFGAFIFSGPLAPYTSQGVGLVLFGNFAACLLIALASGYRGAIAGLSPALVIGMALIGSTMAAEGHALFVTTAVALIIAAVATGALCLVIGQFRLANVVRFIPYPVAGGFVAGIGGAVCIAALSMMGVDPHWANVPGFFDPDVLWKWAPGAAYGLALYLSMRRWRHPFILPVSVVLFVGACHLALFALDISGEEARAAGLLFTSTVEESLWPVWVPADLAHVDWSAMAGQIPDMLTLILVALICVVMNIAGLELAVNGELDWDREFRAKGFATVISGLGGGTVSTLVVPASLRSKLFGATTRLTGVVAALVIGIALLLGDGMLELVPAPLVGGMLVFAGAGMLDEGMVKSWKRLPRQEYGIILLIFAIIIALGLLEGVGAGIAATLVLFAVRLGRADSVEARFTLREHQSNKARPVTDRAILLAEGDRVQAYRLRGYIFFGSVVPLADQLRQALSGPSPPACLMLDFGAVSGFDFSAVSVLGRFLQRAGAAGVRVVLCGVSEPLRIGLERTLPPAALSELLVEPNADRALERCEDIVIAAWRADVGAAGERRKEILEHAGEGLERYLDRQIQFEDLIADLGEWLHPRDHAAGQPLAGQDAPDEGLQLLLSGRASAYDDAGARLYQLGPGDAIWSAGALEGSASSVVADEPCRSLTLPPDTRLWLESHREHLAFRLYRYLLAGHFQAEPAAGPGDST